MRKNKRLALVHIVAQHGERARALADALGYPPTGSWLYVWDEKILCAVSAERVRDVRLVLDANSWRLHPAADAIAQVIRERGLHMVVVHE